MASLLQLLRKTTCRVVQSRFCSSSTEDVVLKGWLKRYRTHGKVVFADVTDGLAPGHVQVVVDKKTRPRNPDGTFADIKPFMSVEACGPIVESIGPDQDTEMLAKSFRVMGECNLADLPQSLLVVEHGIEMYGSDSGRMNAHLRFKNYQFAAVARLRHHIRRAMQNFFDERQFIYVDTPVLSRNDCEGGSAVFQVSAAGDRQQEKVKEAFFDHPMYLTVSGQLELEAAASGIAKVYTLGPAFRAETSMSSRHLCEFHMLEAEVAFLDRLEDLTKLVEDLYRTTVKHVLDKHSDELLTANGEGIKEHLEHLGQVVQKPFVYMSFHEALDVLRNSGELFDYPITESSTDLKTQHERYLLQHCGNVPVFVTDFPAAEKPFYARSNDDEKQTAASFDLLASGVCELAGGTLREERHDVLEQRLEKLGNREQFQWYLDLRRFGTVPHGGFGLGFDRFVSHITNIKSLRDVTPFPRYQ